MENLRLINPKRELLKRLMQTFDSTSALLLIFLADNMDERNQTKITLNELKEQFNMYPPNLSRKLNELAKKGYIKIDKHLDENFNTVVNVYTLPKELRLFKGWLA